MKVELSREDIERILTWKGLMDSEFRISTDPVRPDEELEARLEAIREQDNELVEGMRSAFGI